MPVVFEPMPLGSPGRKREHRIKPIQSLNGGLLIYAKHGGVLRRFHIQPDYVGSFAFKVWIVARHISLQPMWLQPCLRQDAVHAGLAYAHFGRQLANRPVGSTIDRFLLHTGHESFINKLIHGGTTATANYNVTAALATITFAAIIVAGSMAHGFVKHWKNIVPPKLNPLGKAILIPIEIIGMFVRPFALTMRLAANMTGGHIAILSILSFVFLFSEMFRAVTGIGVGVLVSIPLAVLISALEIIVVLVQAYVFTLLSAVFIGMAIHVHH